VFSETKFSIEVLFSAKNCTWKVGDFGLTSEGTSRGVRTTHYARGTSCYRAPELLKEFPVFSNKVDIFALGCILFELVTGGKKAFQSDFFIHEYRSRDQLKIPFTEKIDESSRTEFEGEIYRMLAADRTDRPSSRNLRQKFALNRSVAVGHACHGRGDNQKSILAFTKAIQQGSSDSSIWRPLGDSYQAMGYYDKAILAYESAIEAGLIDPALLIVMGAAHYASLDYRNAISTYRLAMKKDPRNVNLWILIGDAYAHNKQYKEAIRMLRKALTKSGNNVTLLEKLAKIYYVSGDIEKAFKIYPPLRPVSTSPKLEVPKQHHVPQYDESLRSPQSSEFTKLYGWGSRPNPGNLKIDTSAACLEHNPIEDDQLTLSLIEVTADGITATMTRKPRVKKLRVNGLGGSPSGGAFQSPALCTPSDLTNQSWPNVSIIAKRQQIAQLSNIIDAYSSLTISVGTLVAALEGYSPEHFDQTAVHYGDVVVVKEIFEDGWVLGIKLKKKVWEDDYFNANIYPSPDTISEGQRKGSTSAGKIERRESESETQAYLFELIHFCHSEEWENVLNFL